MSIRPNIVGRVSGPVESFTVMTPSGALSIASIGHSAHEAISRWMGAEMHIWQQSSMRSLAPTWGDFLATGHRIVPVTLVRAESRALSFT